MSSPSTDNAVIGSAIVVGGIYAYRHFTEGDTQSSTTGTAKRAAGVGAPLPLSGFLVAWGFVFLLVAIAAEASPQVGRNAAILIAVGDILTNGTSILTDVTAHSTGSASSSRASSEDTGVTNTDGTPNYSTDPSQAPGIKNPRFGTGANGEPAHVQVDSLMY